MKIKKCKDCNKEFKATNGNHILCSLCSKERNRVIVRINSRKRYLEKRDDPEFIKKNSEIYKRWYKKNKEYFKVYNKNFREKNKEKARERNYVDFKTIKIEKILGDKCKECGKKAEEMHHLKYDGLPKGNIKEYCKFLEPLCKKCHRRKHRRL